MGPPETNSTHLASCYLPVMPPPTSIDLGRALRAAAPLASGRSGHPLGWLAGKRAHRRGLSQTELGVGPKQRRDTHLVDLPVSFLGYNFLQDLAISFNEPGGGGAQAEPLTLEQQPQPPRKGVPGPTPPSLPPVGQG